MNSNFSQLGNEIVTLKTEMNESAKKFSEHISEVQKYLPKNISPAENIGKTVSPNIIISESGPAPIRKPSVRSSKVKIFKKKKPAPKKKDKMDGSSILVYILKGMFNLLNTIISSRVCCFWPNGLK